MLCCIICVLVLDSLCNAVLCNTAVFLPLQRVTQASTKHMLETSSVQNALHTVSAMEKAPPSATARGAFTGLRKILPRWPVHVSSRLGAFVFTHNRVLVSIELVEHSCGLLEIRCSCKSSLVSRTYLCVKVCIKESRDELHGFCSAASSSLMIHWLSLRLHICIKLQFNRPNSPLIKKLFSCHWDRRGDVWEPYRVKLCICLLLKDKAKLLQTGCGSSLQWEMHCLILCKVLFPFFLKNRWCNIFLKTCFQLLW